MIVFVFVIADYDCFLSAAEFVGVDEAAGMLRVELQSHLGHFELQVGKLYRQRESFRCERSLKRKLTCQISSIFRSSLRSPFSSSGTFERNS